MFNSDLLIGTAIRLNNNEYKDDDILITACRDFHIDIVRTTIEMWKDQGETDQSFSEHFESVFPPGYIRRNIDHAKSVIFDLYDIAISSVIRFELPPIYVYVMYRMIEERMEIWEDIEDIFDFCEIETYLLEHNASEEEQNHIRAWFSSRDDCAGDFAETYNSDYTNLDVIESIATMYLEDGGNSPRLKILDVSIEDFLDLLPNDIRELCLKKREREKHMMISYQTSTASHTNQAVVFISYSWDNDSHKNWVRTFAEQLSENGIKVILDQNDLILGDPLPLFMEQSITNSNYVLIICTPQYKAKADARKGGVGYEESIITSDILLNQNHRKYITILASGTWETSVPTWAGGKLGLDMTDSQQYEENLLKLISTINNNS